MQPESEANEPETTSDDPIIDLEGDDDSNDLGLLDTRAPDQMLDDEESLDEIEPDENEHSDGEPAEFVGREWNRTYCS